MNLYNEFFNQIVDWQYYLNSSIASYIKSVNENGLSAAIVVLGI